MGNKYESVPKPTPENVTPGEPNEGGSEPWGTGSVALRSNAGRKAAEREREERLALVRARRSQRGLPRPGVALGGLLALLGVIGWVALHRASGGSETRTLGVAGGEVQIHATRSRRGAEVHSTDRSKRRGTERSRRRAKRRREHSAAAARRQAKVRKAAATTVARPEPALPPTSVESTPAPAQETTAEPTEPAASAPPSREPEAATQEFGFER
jgi:hypothetical protein